MLDTFNFANPQTCNYQEFYGGGSTRDWIKPRGVTMVRMLLIGAGAGGRAGSTSSGGAGGGSGAITTWIGPAIFIPDELRISIGAGGAGASAGGNTSVIYQQKNGTGYTLLNANGAPSQTAGTAFANNYFGAAGIFNSIAGQAGANVGTGGITASTTTFLSGGADGSAIIGANGGQVATNYGYPTVLGSSGTTGGDGYFLTQPLFLGVGGAGGVGSATSGGVGGKAGIGCGGGGGGLGTITPGAGGKGGDGAVFIWSW
jgi:hypothetical protein